MVFSAKYQNSECFSPKYTFVESSATENLVKFKVFKDFIASIWKAMSKSKLYFCSNINIFFYLQKKLIFKIVMAVHFYDK